MEHYAALNGNFCHSSTHQKAILLDYEEENKLRHLVHPLYEVYRVYQEVYWVYQ